MMSSNSDRPAKFARVAGVQRQICRQRGCGNQQDGRPASRAFRPVATTAAYTRPYARATSPSTGSGRKLQQLHAARELRDLAAFPANRLEALAGDRRGQHSIRVNDRYRICFVWRDGDAADVEIVDYH